MANITARLRQRLPALAHVVLLLFPLAVHFLFDIRPLERFPGWDLLWSDSLVAGKASLNRLALDQCTVPAISPYHGLGHNLAGDGPALTPFLSPFTPLLAFMDVTSWMQFRFLCCMYIGLWGVYLLLRELNGSGIEAISGALLYCAIPVQFTNQQYYFTIGFYILPTIIFAIAKYANTRRAWWLFVLGISSFFAYSTTDIFFLIIVPIVSCLAAFLACEAGSTLYRRIATAMTVVAIAIASGSFYIVPLYSNLREIKAAATLLDSLGHHSPPPITTVGQFWDFFTHFGVPSYYLPQPSTAMAFYVPAFFLLYAVVAMSNVGARAFRRQTVRMAACMFLAAFAMIGVSFSFYSLPEAMLASAKGILRYHLNLWPFFVILGCFCLAIDPVVRRERLRIVLVAAFLALFIDAALFCVERPAPAAGAPAGDWFYVRHQPRFAEGLHVPNAISFRVVTDMWQLLPLLNLAIPVLVLIAGFRQDAHGSRVARIGRALSPAAVGAFAVTYIAVHNEIRVTQQSGWQEIGRSDYHLNSYMLRKEHLDQNIPAERRLNYRLLPASADVFRLKRGRNWKFCADTELLGSSGFKMLFSYREMEHPFCGLLYSKFYRTTATTNFFPPLSESVPQNLGVCRLLGVGYVLSADEEIKSDELTPFSRIDIPNPPFNETVAGGPVHIYGIAGASGIASFFSHATESEQRDAIRHILEWDGSSTLKSLFLEGATVAKASTPSTYTEGKARISAETLNSVDIDVDAPTPGFLSLGYIYRPFWRALVNGKRVPVLRANGMFMAVAVGQGASTVRFTYIPWDVYSGYAVSGATLLTCLGLAWKQRNRRRDCQFAL